MNSKAIHPTGSLPYLPSQPKAKKKQSEKQRNPYDGLRPWSAITHGIGALLAVAGLISLWIRAQALGHPPLHTAALLIYGFSMVTLYTASTLYHSLNTSVKGRVALKKFDHCCIYFLIAGSYTPICMIALTNGTSIGYILCAIIWGLGLGGTAMTLLWISAPRWVTSGVYLFMGWVAIWVLRPLAQVLPTGGMALLVGGGILYSIGGILYAVKWPGRNRPHFGCHEIFHVFIVLGSAAHFILIYDIIAQLP